MSAPEHPFLDAWRNPTSGVRVEVERYREVAPASNQYFESGRSAGVVLAYVRRFGLVAVLRKVRSRLAERARNRKFLILGVGRVLEAPSEGPPVGAQVAFVAPNHRVAGRLVVDHGLTRPVEELVSGDDVEEARARIAMAKLTGWAPESGRELPEQHAEHALRHALHAADARPPDADREVRERVDVPTRADDRPSAVLFGLGNYAKTQIVPRIQRQLRLECVHDLDPDQLATARSWGVSLDTSPVPRASEAYDAWFVAGFHHTHGQLAIHALRMGKYAIVEKPLVTTREDLLDLENTLAQQDESRLFVAYQRRYSVLNEWARADLGVDDGEPIHYHCVAYEIPLPDRHWYRWPNSRSRLTSNGCHWIDHFLHANGYPEVRHRQARRAANGDVTVALEADNGACFHMVLTEHGSSRLGVRDHVELRAGNVTVTITDQHLYVAEDSRRVIRKRRVNPMSAYGRMYRACTAMVVAGSSGDELRTLRSAKLVLDLEDMIGDEPDD